MCLPTQVTPHSWFSPRLPNQVLDYQNTSHTLLPLVASAYALHFMGETMMAMYKQFEKDRWGVAGVGGRCGWSQTWRPSGAFLSNGHLLTLCSAT